MSPVQIASPLMAETSSLRHSAYHILPRGIDAIILAAVLNSPAVEFLLRSRAPVVKDGFSRYRRQFLLDLPVPELSPDMEARIRAAVTADSPDELNSLTSTLFGVDAKDVQRALADLNPRRPSVDTS